MADYATRTDMDNVFGSDNINKWANVNGNSNAIEITGRVAWALEQATAEINDELFLGPYEIPFTAPIPLQVVRQCATFAGVLLYEARGVADSEDDQDGAHKLRLHRKNVMRFLGRIVSGRIRFAGVTLRTHFPKAIIDGD